MRSIRGNVTLTVGNFHEAYNKEFRTSRLETRTEHIRHIRLQTDYNNNKMERMNGEIRDREKVMRGLERKDSPILTGYQLFHNYIRPHKALDYKTPAEMAGIKVKGENTHLRRGAVPSAAPYFCAKSCFLPAYQSA